MKLTSYWKSFAACVLPHLLLLWLINTSIPEVFTMWYANLKKPLFAISTDYISGLTFVVYLLLGISYFFQWTSKVPYNLVMHKRYSLILHYILVIFISSWFYIFFVFKLLDLAIIISLLAWVLVLFLYFFMKKISHKAGYMLIPISVWLTYNFVLSWAFWQLNH